MVLYVYLVRSLLLWLNSMDYMYMYMPWRDSITCIAFPQIEAQASIFFVTFLTLPLNGANLYLGAGLYFVLCMQALLSRSHVCIAGYVAGLISKLSQQ